MKVTKLKWNKPEADESFYESVCGRFEISPLYLGRCKPQGYVVWDKKTGIRKRTYNGLKWAKEIANDINLKIST